MKKLILLIALVVLGTGILMSCPAKALEIEHPYLQSEEYKKAEAELNSKKNELQKLNTEFEQLAKEKKEFSRGAMGILAYLGFLPFLSVINWILLATVVLIVLYILYLRKYNPAKWFIFFQSKNNLDLLLKKIQENNKIMVVLLLLPLLLQPSSVCAATDALTDAKYFLFGNEIEQGYVKVKYPKKGRDLPYDNAKGIKVYRSFDGGSFEQQYDYLVHQFALGTPPKASDVIGLIDRVKNIENLQSSYAFLSKLDTQTMKEVVQKRLGIIPKIRGDLKYTEIEIMLDELKKADRLDLLSQDIATTVLSLIPEATGTTGTLQIAYLLVDVDRSKANELLDKIKYKLREIIGNEASETRFRHVYKVLRKTRTDIYKPDDTFQIDDQPEGFKVLVAAFFDQIDEQIASAVMANFPVKKTTSVKNEYEKLIDLWKKYRAKEVPEFFNHLTSEFVKCSKCKISDYMKYANHLGYQKDAAVDALFKIDDEQNGYNAEKSTLISKEFLDLCSGDCLARNFQYLKNRTPQASLVLNALFAQNYDLFLDYLNYCHGKDSQIISGLSFENKIAGFGKWDKIVGGHAIKNFRAPAGYYLAVKELSNPQPERIKIRDFIRQSSDERLKSLIMTDNSQDDAGYLDELMLYHLYARMNEPQSPEIQVFETSIATQTKARVAQQIAELNSELTKTRGMMASLRDELDRMKIDKLTAQLASILATVLIIIICIYILLALFFSVKYSINAVASYTGTRIGLFAAVFAETFSKCLVPILYFTGGALLVIIIVQLFGFLRSKDREFPNTERSLANYLKKEEEEVLVAHPGH